MIREMLRETMGAEINLICADRLSQGLQRLAKGDIDLLLLDLSLPDGHGLPVCVEVQERAPEVPIIVLTGLDDETVAVKALRNGAQDYLVKGQVDSRLLTRSIHYAIERKQAEKREKQLQQELNLSSRLASIGSLAAGIAHEINNPLVGVIGFSQILLAKDSTNGIRKELTIINDNAQRVANIVKNVLTFANPKPRGKESTDINTLIRQVVEIHAYEMKTNNIESRVDLMAGLPRTLADYNQIQQVMLNIIANAVQGMKKASGRGKLSITTRQIDNNIQILISDDGPGIAKHNTDKIFDPFFTTKDPGEGTGLGLSISYSIIKEHHGRLYARNNRNGGATFTIKLPIVGGTEKPEQVEADADEPGISVKARILVVDDEPSVCQVVKHALSNDGHEVETISDAAAAFERLREKRYNLILLDIKMPGMGGMEFYNRLPEIAFSLRGRVMFMTGDTVNSETRAFLQNSKAIYIGKPFEIRQLKQLTNKALTRNH